MKLDQYIDLDRELHLGHSAGGAGRNWRADVRGKRGRSDEQLLLEWLGEERTGGISLGELVRSVFQWASVVVILAGLLAGTAAGAALLHYDGSQPINVLLYMAVIIGIQLLMIPLALVAFIYRGQLGGALRLMQGLVGWLMRRLMRTEASQTATGMTLEELEAEWGRLRSRGSLYSQVQPALLLLLFQSFGVAFNLAVLGTLTFLVLFSDLTFAWATTLQADAEAIHRITSALSTPWAAIWPEARPSLELVQATRFARLDAAFVGTGEAGSLLAGGWWRFLAAATFTYGFLPRAIAAVAAGILFRREMRRALVRNGRVQALTERLRTPRIVVGPDQAVEVESEPDEAGERLHVGQGNEPGGDLRLGVLFWAYDYLPDAGAVEQVLQNALGAKVSFMEEAGKVDTAERAALEQLKAAREAGRVDGAAIFFEPFEPPKTDARRFLRAVREVVGESAPVLVLLGEFAEEKIMPPAEAEQEIWQRAVGAMGDPFLFFRTLNA